MRRTITIVTSLASFLGILVVYWSQALMSAAVVVGAPACSNVDAGLLGEITGVEVLSSTLTAGRGCGTGPQEVFMYASIVSLPTSLPPASAQYEGQYVASVVSDCFTNATFNELCTYVEDAGGINSYDVAIYAFNEADWNTYGAAVTADVTGAASATAGIMCGAGNPTQIPGNLLNPPGTTVPVPRDQAYATWSTTCTATQQESVPVIANCRPLVARDGGTLAAVPDDAGSSDAGPPDADTLLDAAASDATND